MLYLASQSPRRAELLRQLQVSFEVVPAQIDETLQLGESPEAFVVRLAVEKARAGQRHTSSSAAVLGSDTVVVCDGEALGKPIDQRDSARMLTSLSGRTHQVMTAVAVVRGEVEETCTVVTDVTFTSLSAAEIEAYWHTGEPADKAGSYGIQGIAGKFVSHISGSYSAVVGLPLYETNQLLKRMGVVL